MGIVQGLAEFLPVSSSGHIVLAQYLLGIRDVGAEHRPDLSFEIILHLGTLVSVLIFFKKSLWSLILSLFQQRDEGGANDDCLARGGYSSGCGRSIAF